MNQVSIGKLMDAAEAAEYLGLRLSRIRYEVFLGRLPHIKLGRSVRFTKEQLDSWVAKNSVIGGVK